MVLRYLTDLLSESSSANNREAAEELLEESIEKEEELAIRRSQPIKGWWPKGIEIEEEDGDYLVVASMEDTTYLVGQAPS